MKIAFICFQHCLGDFPASHIVLLRATVLYSNSILHIPLQHSGNWTYHTDLNEKLLHYTNSVYLFVPYNLKIILSVQLHVGLSDMHFVPHILMSK